MKTKIFSQVNKISPSVRTRISHFFRNDRPCNNVISTNEVRRNLCFDSHIWLITYLILFSLLLCLIQPALCENFNNPVLSIFQDANNFYLGGATYPKIRVYAEDLKNFNVQVYRLNSFPLKDGAFDLSGSNINGNLVYSRDFYYNSNLNKEYSSWKDNQTGLTHECSYGLYKIFGTISLPISQNGIYIAKIQSGKLSQKWFFIISPLCMVVKNTNSEVSGFVYNQLENMPSNNVSVKLFADSKMVGKTKADQNGLFTFKNLDIKKRFTVIAKTNDYNPLFSFYSFRVNPADYPEKLYLYTDRPIYRPGHEVFFKGITATETSDKPLPLKGQKITYEISDPNDNTLIQKELVTNDYGTFNDSFKIPQNSKVGLYTIKTKINQKEFYDTFKVDFYRKPEFEVFIMPTEEYIIQGQPLTVKIKSLFYTGNPIKDGNFAYSVYASPSYFYPDDTRNDVLNFINTTSGKEEFVCEGVGKLDENGLAQFEILPLKFQQDMAYRIEVSVKDLNNKTVTSSKSVYAYLSRLKIGIKPQSILIKKGEKVDVLLFLKDASNNPSAGTVKIALSQSIWNPRTKEFDYKIFAKQDIEINSSGNTLVSIPVNKAGRIKIQADTTDICGNSVSSNAFFWVEGDTGKSSLPSFDIIKDRIEYKNGETAKILINSAIPNVWAFITLEGDEIYNKQVKFIKNNTLSLNIPIKKEYSDNLYVHISYIYKGQYAGGSCWMYVPSKDKFIKVDIKPESEIYAPSDTAKFKVTTKDNNDNPIKCELSFGLVDEAVYALCPENIISVYDYFYGKRPNKVVTGYSVPREFTGGSYQKVEKPDEQKTRKNFKDTAFWSPVIYTDENGSAKIEVKLPDNLTKWRATCRAVSNDLQAGSNTGNIISKKDLVVSLGLPRYFIENDKIELSAIIQNYTKLPQDITVNFNAKGIKSDKNNPQNLDIKAMDASALNVNAVITDAKTANITGYAKNKEGLFDAVSIDIPILPKGIEKSEYISGCLTDTCKETVKFPATSNPATYTACIRITPTILSSVIGSLQYLIDYPYGCVEQTMSRFYPNLAVIRMLKELNLENKAVDEKLKSIMPQCLGRLYFFQHSDGGWGWWKEDETSAFMTAYVIEGLTLAKQEGYIVDEEIYQKGLISLKNIAQTESDPELLAYIYYVMAEAKILDVAVIDKFRSSYELNIKGLSYLSIAYAKLNMPDISKEIIAEIMEEAIRVRDTYHWDDNELKPNIESTALALRALSLNNMLEEKDDVIFGILKWLMLERKGNYWDNSKTTSIVLLSLTDYLLKSKEINQNATCDIYWNGKLIKNLTIQNSIDEEVKIDIPSELIKTQNTFEIKKKEENWLYYTSNITYFDKDLKPIDNGIKVEKKYLVKNKEDKWIEADLKNLNISDEIKVSITADMDYDGKYLMIEDILPSGAEIKDIEGTWERKNDSTIAFFNATPQNPWLVEYTINLERPGKLIVLPAKALLMYDPATYGISNSFEIDVNK